MRRSDVEGDTILETTFHVLIRIFIRYFSFIELSS